LSALGRLVVFSPAYVGIKAGLRTKSGFERQNCSMPDFFFQRKRRAKERIFGVSSDCHSRPAVQPIGRALSCAIAALARLACSGADDVDAVVAHDGDGDTDQALTNWLRPYRRIRRMTRAGMVRSPDAWRAFRFIHERVVALRQRRDGTRSLSPLPEPLKVIRCRFANCQLRSRGIHRRGFKVARGDPDPHTAPPTPWLEPGGRTSVSSSEKTGLSEGRKHCTDEFNSAPEFFHPIFFGNGELRLDGGRR
jgi:hypothetical protein